MGFARRRSLPTIKPTSHPSVRGIHCSDSMSDQSPSVSSPSLRLCSGIHELRLPPQRRHSRTRESESLSHLTIACYSAAISSEPGNAIGCGRGGIAGRWTKPVATTKFVACRQNANLLRGRRLGELYRGLRSVTSFSSSWRKASCGSHQGWSQTGFLQYTATTYCSTAIYRFACAAWHQDLALGRRDLA